MNLPEGGEGWLYGLLIALGGAFGWSRVQRKGLSSDNKAIAEDRGHTSLNEKLTRRVDQLEAQNSALREENKTLNADAARLTSEVTYLKTDLARVAAELRRRTRGLSPDVRRILDTGFAELDDTDKK